MRKANIRSLFLFSHDLRADLLGHPAGAVFPAKDLAVDVDLVQFEERRPFHDGLW